MTTDGLVPKCGYYKECDDRVRAPAKPALRFSTRWPVGSAGTHQGDREAGPGVRQHRPSLASLSRQGIYAQLGRWPPGLPGWAGGGPSHTVTQHRAKPAVSLQRGLLMNLPWTPKTLHGALVAATAPAAVAFCTIPRLHISGCRRSPGHAVLGIFSLQQGAGAGGEVGWLCLQRLEIPPAQEGDHGRGS